MRKELYLTWTVEEDVVLVQLLQTFCEPFHIVLELFQSVKNGSVGTQLVACHDLFQRHKIAHIDGARIGRLIVGWIEVDDGALSPHR